MKDFDTIVYNSNEKGSPSMARYIGVKSLPEESTLKDMYRNGFRFKVDGKSVGIKSLIEMAGDVRNGKS